MIDGELKRKLEERGLDKKILENDFAMREISSIVSKIIRDRANETGQSENNVSLNALSFIGKNGEFVAENKSKSGLDVDNYSWNVSIDPNGMVKIDTKITSEDPKTRNGNYYSNSSLYTPNGVEMKRVEKSHAFKFNPKNINNKDNELGTTTTIIRLNDLMTAQINQIRGIGTYIEANRSRYIFVGNNEHPEQLGYTYLGLFYKDGQVIEDEKIPNLIKGDIASKENIEKIKQLRNNIKVNHPENPLAKMIAEQEHEKQVSSQDIADIYNSTSPDKTQSAIDEIKGLENKEKQQENQEQK